MLRATPPLTDDGSTCALLGPSLLVDRTMHEGMVFSRSPSLPSETLFPCRAIDLLHPMACRGCVEKQKHCKRVPREWKCKKRAANSLSCIAIW